VNLDLWRFRAFGMLRRIGRYIVTDVSVDTGAFILRIQQSKNGPFQEWLNLKINVPRFFEISATRCNVPEELNFLLKPLWKQQISKKVFAFPPPSPRFWLLLLCSVYSPTHVAKSCNIAFILVLLLMSLAN